jgi:hypothetical protein
VTTTAAPSTYVPLRSKPNVPDNNDSNRLQLVRSRWDSQDPMLAQRDKQIEENIRMLAGRQWEVFSPTLGRFVDVSIFMNDKERAFRQRPVINRLFYWFMLTHARLTENPPVVSFQPSTADRKDAILAEIMDVVFKTQWLEVGMLEVLDRLVAWLIPSGAAYLKSRIDFTGGEMVEMPQTAADEAGNVSINGRALSAKARCGGRVQRARSARRVEQQAVASEAVAHSPFVPDAFGVQGALGDRRCAGRCAARRQ